MEAMYNLAVLVSVMDKFTGPVRKMADTLGAFEKQAQRANAAIDFGNKMAVSGALTLAASAGITRGLFGLLGPTRETSGAIGELASLGIQDFNALSRAARDFAAKWSGTTEAQFLGAAYDIKSGIATLTDDAVGEYTRMAALTGKATKATTAEMTSLFATGYGIFKDMYAAMGDMEFGEMFSAGIAASVKNFKTTGAGMSQAMTSLGAAGASALRPMEEQLAVLGMLQTTMPGGEAGTKYKAFLQSAARAGQALGVSFVDTNGQLLGMVDILERLRGKYGDTLNAIEKQEMQKAFGTEEAVALIDLMYGKLDLLRSNVDTLGISMRQGTAFTEGMAQAMNDDVGAAIDVFNQNISISKRIIGDELGGLLKAVLPSIQAGVENFQRFAEANPVLLRIILLLALFAAGFLALTGVVITGIAAIAWVWGYFLLGISKGGQGILKMMGFLKTLSRVGLLNLFRLSGGIVTLASRVLWLAVTIMPALIGSVWAFTAALLANPITWIILGIMALIAAIVLLWRNWDKVTNLIKQYCPQILAAISPFIGIPLLIARNWDTIKDFVGNALDMARNYISNRFAEWKQSGMALIDAFVGGIQMVIDKPAEVVKSGLQKLRNLLPFSDAKEGPLSQLTRSGMALVETFAWGIQRRAPMLQAVTAEALGQVGFSAGGYQYNGPGLRAISREVTRESSTYERDRRPIVIMMGGQQPPDNMDSIIDQAYRYLDMRSE